MRYDKPISMTPLDARRIVAQPVDRVDGPAKLSGAATYSYEYHEEVPGAAYGMIVPAAIAKGRIVAIDSAAAEAAEGVLMVMTHRNAPRQGSGGDAAPQLVGSEIAHHGQAVALVVAETFEQARHAAGLVRVDYEREPGRFDLAEAERQARPPRGGEHRMGDFEAAFAASPFAVDVSYTTPDQAHAMMEPHASIARWDGDRLTLWSAQQLPDWSVGDIAATLAMPSEHIRIISRFIGGGFGGKISVYADAILSALAARALGRPVKLALTRQQIFNGTSHRPATIQRLRLGCDAEGRLLAIGHDSVSGNLPGRSFEEGAASQTRLLYAAPNRLIRNRKAVLDLAPAASMRAPGEAAGLLALECALDELAEKAGIDPVEMRVINDTPHDPERGPARPFSSRKLVEALREGQRRFGWERRDPVPCRVRDGRWLVGMGVASAIRENYVVEAKARVRLDGQGRLTVETSMTDIGTGSYTILAQVAAEAMGLPLDAVTVRLGDTRLPRGPGSGGSWGANSAGTAVYDACMALRDMLAQKAGLNSTDARFEGGMMHGGGRSLALAELAGEGVSAEGEMLPGGLTQSYAQASFGAHFAEVGVAIDSGEVRLRRMLGVFAAGRLLNPKTARSQAIGGMVFGVGAALMEANVVDRRHGLFINHDLAEYHVPAHADLPDIDAIFLDEEDDKSTPLKTKGVGELGICGAGAAIANAIHNACGVRVRDYPVTLDKLLDGLPPIG
ncbi:xanthine dehydrogenase [Sphingomonas oleivorans]|uniref:Xanthine dehydrogenase n=1 Tax=Sphingomonas oleivorans TaxID=1735121 RepID=A0A2T5FVB0_9SPHN|nr:xanthine dehydrogenase family protein molybdopterin-binding subunit [Sphingomonas oleivorans]PTQ09384.1 xanthine dehydrogenase [Sphingomonas oleivorans]